MWRRTNPKGELTTSIIQLSSQTNQMPTVGLGLRRRHFCGGGSHQWDSWITRLCREINLSGILPENDIVRWLFTRWPPSQPPRPHSVQFCAVCAATFVRPAHILCSFVRPREGNVTSWRSVDTGEIIRAFCPQLVNLCPHLTNFALLPYSCPCDNSPEMLSTLFLPLLALLNT